MFLIGECIDEYEEKTNQKIRFVSFYCDKERTKYIRNNGWCITQRAFDATWSKLPALNYHLNRNYDQGEIDDNIAHYFFDHDWNTFSAEQVICEGDTAHVCTF